MPYIVKRRTACLGILYVDVYFAGFDEPSGNSQMPALIRKTERRIV
jgi:hypothetical protein